MDATFRSSYRYAIEELLGVLPRMGNELCYLVCVKSLMKKTQWNIVGHRGFPDGYPENTIPGIRAALELGVDAVEIDIQLSHDGVPLVFHDASLDRTTEVTGALRARDFHELQNISCHYPARFEQRFAPIPIASLEQVSKVLQGYPCEWFLEIKRQSLELLGRQELLSRVLEASSVLADRRRIISFDVDILEICKGLCELPVGWCLREYTDAEKQRALTLNPEFLIARAGLIGDAPLWPGPWQWFIYDINGYDDALFWHERGAAYLEVDNPQAILAKGSL